MNPVKNKVLLVTGGAAGIGLSMVKKVLECGAKGVAIVDVSAEQGNKALADIDKAIGKTKVIFIKADITVKNEFQDAFETTVKTFHQLDIVINNAGIANEIEWEKTVAVNLVAVIEGTYLAMKKYLPQYKSGEEGIVVNIASNLSLTTLQPMPVYCATKHALIGLGKSLGGAAFYEKYKTRVLTLCPGLTNTSLPETAKTEFSKEFLDSETKIVSGFPQRPEYLADALIEVIRNGKNGTVWLSEGGKPVVEVTQIITRNGN